MRPPCLVAHCGFRQQKYPGPEESWYPDDLPSALHTCCGDSAASLHACCVFPPTCQVWSIWIPPVRPAQSAAFHKYLLNGIVPNCAADGTVKAQRVQVPCSEYTASPACLSSESESSLSDFTASHEPHIPSWI